MYSLSSEVNGTDLTFTLPNVTQFESMVTGHLNAAALALITDDAFEAPLDALRVDVKLTHRPFDTTDVITAVNEEGVWLRPMTGAGIVDGFVERVVIESWRVSDVVLSIRETGDEAVTYYLLISHGSSEDWVISDHVLVQTETEGGPENGPDDGHFLELSLLEQLRHFATS